MKINSLLLASVAFVSASLTGNAAYAAPLLFSYSPTTDTTGAFTFNIDSDPVPLYTNTTRFEAAITNGTGRYAGVPTLLFYNASDFGAFGQYFGPQLYSGDESTPTFKTGMFSLFYQGSSSFAGTLTISDVAVAAVPESATWAMMLAGFGMIGFAARKRSTVKTTVAYA